MNEKTEQESPPLRKLPDDLRLRQGSHDSPEEGVSLMEAVAYVAGEEFTDHPECVSPVIATFCRSWNDDLDDANRQRLIPYIPRLIGTRGREATEQRLAWMAVDWLARVQAPAWLRLSPGLKEHGDKLAALPELTPATVEAAQPTLDAAGDAAGDAAWTALVPTRDALIEEAFTLLDRMIAVAKDVPLGEL